MLCRQVIVVVILPLLGLLWGQVTAAEVGTTSGQFEVTPSGSATYTIPITIPPGTAGTEPKVAISYNSQGSNGLLGVGWSLQANSVITRCQTTLAEDGYIDGVDFDNNDKLCLDGRRLVAVWVLMARTAHNIAPRSKPLFE